MTAPRWLSSSCVPDRHRRDSRPPTPHPQQPRAPSVQVPEAQSAVMPKMLVMASDAVAGKVFHPDGDHASTVTAWACSRTYGAVGA